MRFARYLLAAPILLVGCSSEGGTGPIGTVDPGVGWKEDSAFLSNSSYELGTLVTGRVSHAASGDWADLATNRELQERLIDEQIKFGKRAMIAQGYLLNQLVDKVGRELDENNDIVVTVDDTVDPAIVTIEYTASVDIIKNEGRGTQVPGRLEDIAVREFTLPLPADPIDMYTRFDTRCHMEDTEGGSVSNYNYYYYYQPTRTGCDVAQAPATMTINEIHRRTNEGATVYPEYDKLIHAIDGEELQGFTVALFPTEGDNQALSTHDNLRSALVDQAPHGLAIPAGEAMSDGLFTRFRWERGGALIRIDLYNPVEVDRQSDFRTKFREALGSYDMVQFAGHSEYGSRDLYRAEDIFKPDYQIIYMWSCHSVNYYSRQIFRGKQQVNPDDFNGWDGADFVGTAPTPYFGDEDDGLRELLRGLGNGVAAVNEGRRSEAPSWLDIVTALNTTSSDVPYGAAGVRENDWQP